MLNYRIHGDGPPLVLLHGFGISFNIWNGLRPLLVDHFTCIEVELPGIGLSPLPLPDSSYPAAAVDALDSLRNSLALPRWSVLGYSSGSRIAEAYLQTNPARVERAVFLCPARTSADKAFGLRVASAIDMRFPQLGTWTLSGWRIRFLIHLLGFNLRRHSPVDAWRDEIISQPVDILKATLRSMPEGGSRPFEFPDSIPALFVWGKEDWITATPKRPSRREVIIHADHSMPQTKTKEAAEMIVPFLIGR